MDEQHKLQAQVVMGSLKRQADVVIRDLALPPLQGWPMSTSAVDMAPLTTDDSSARVAGREGKRRRALYVSGEDVNGSADQSDVGDKGAAASSSGETARRSKEFSVRLRELLGKEDMRRWQTVLKTFSTSAKRLPDMQV